MVHANLRGIHLPTIPPSTSALFACFLSMDGIQRTVFSKEALEEAASEYRQVFPFNDFDPALQHSYLATIERSETLKDKLHELGTKCEYFDSLVMVLNMLKDQHLHLSAAQDLSFYFFMDCLGNGGAAANLAYINGFHRCLSIEVSAASKSRSIAAQEHMAAVFGPLGAPQQRIAHKVGSMQDYFDFEANIVFLSTIEAAANPMVDEARLLLLFTDLVKNLEMGSYAIIMTKHLPIGLFVPSESDNSRLLSGDRCAHLKTLFSRERDEESGVDHHACLLQVVPIKKAGRPNKK